MRIFDPFSLALVGLGLVLTPALAFDGARAPAQSVAPAPALALDGTRTPATQALTPIEAFRSYGEALRAGEKDKALSRLQYSAEQGFPAAQWKLGRMYAEGDGVPRSDVRAFEYFSRIANSHADDNPGTPQARFVANAFVALGHYYLEGIPDSIKADPDRAREMFSYAASYFGDPDAQYNLARLYLDGTPVSKPDPRQAARWLALAANKGQYQAQALLGHLLFKGDRVPRQAARGLMWLTLASDGASAKEKWISDLYDAAVKQASEDERAMAMIYIERWVRGRRD